MNIRRYKKEDIEEIIELFYGTIYEINKKDYSKEQLDAWIRKNSGGIDKDYWNSSFLENITYVALEDDKIVGFGDITKEAYLDRLYVHKDYQNQGVGTTLCEVLEKSVEGKTVTTDASITAKSFFLKRGYKIITEQIVKRDGVFLKNFKMRKG